LDTWSLSNLANPGKADDRVISVAFNILKYALPLSYISLPLEYLWLTDNYLFQKKEDASQEEAIIEHPECLTAEDAAEGASSNREPEYYSKLVSDAIACERVGGKFYEYIFFPSEDMVETLGPYLRFLKNATVHIKEDDDEYDEKLFSVVPFAEKYGDRNAVAERNIAASQTETDVPTTFDIPKILKQLKDGNDVKLNMTPEVEEKSKLMLEFIAKNKKTKYSADSVNPDMKPEFDMAGPFFFSAKSRVLYHVLAMCETPADLTKIFNKSHTFLALIRCFWVR
jgi:hypothetical protein